MTDTFTMSVGLAHDLQTAFRRNGWNVNDVKKLTEGDTLAQVRNFIVAASAKELLIRAVFTEKNCRALGPEFSTRARHRAVGLAWSTPPVLTLGDLCKMSEGELHRVPMMGNRAIDLIKAMLAHHGLQLADG